MASGKEWLPKTAVKFLPAAERGEEKKFLTNAGEMLLSFI